MQILTGHTSPETAYVLSDYPYGFKLRCSIRYWIEYKPKLGCRVISQTTNPKRSGTVWNNQKSSTYSRFGAALYLDDAGHVRAAGLNEYSNGAEAEAWRAMYGAGVPSEAVGLMDRWVAAKLAYDAARKPGDGLVVGLPEARVAFVSAS